LPRLGDRERPLELRRSVVITGWPNNLPAQFTSFVGRARECEQVREALAGARLLVLTGSGGAGKTRLATRVAIDSAELFRDGAWWVELAPLREGDQLGAAVAQVLGVRPLPGRTPLQAAVDRLGDERSLVVLDNCEHVLETAADVAEALLRGCPQVTVLATSREPLGVPGESEWRVPPLSLPATDAPEVVARSDAVRLFAERAANVRPEFALADSNVASVAEICRRLDGIPLAIELASARLRMLSADQIAAALNDRLWLLTRGSRRVIARHQTLRASLDWSYELLTETEQALFRRLAVFAGGWSFEAVESVLGGDGPDGGSLLDLLSSLIDKSLVVAEDDGRVARYRMLETVGQYALELMEASGEQRGLRDRHLAFFLALAERAAPELNSPRDRAWLTMLDPEAANFEVAIDHGIETDPEQALRICIALTKWREVRGRLDAGHKTLRRALDAADPSPGPLRARALWSGGHLARNQGDWQAAFQFTESALEIAESIGDEATTARALLELGLLRMFVDPRAARAALARSLALARGAGDDWAVMAASMPLAWSHVITDDYDEAEGVFDAAIPAVDLTGLEGVTWTGFGRGWLAMVRADHDRCRELCQQTVSAARELGQAMVEALAQAVLARDETLQGRAGAALERVQESEPRVIAKGAGTAIALPMTRIEMASAHAALGRLDRAQELLEVVVAGGADHGWVLCQALAALARVLRVLGDQDGALARTKQVLELSERLQARLLAAAARDLLARLAIGRGEWSAADALAHEALAQQLEIGARAWLPDSLDTLALVAAGLESHTEAARLLGAAERARSDLALVRWPPDAPAFDELEERLAGRLGGEAFEAARAGGAAMTLDQAIGWVRRARGTRKRPAGGWESLTPTERQVVELVAQGLTNPQVAERIFISRATVKTHLAHVFQKLDVSSRAELTALAVRRSG
jgi:predicted ATPase/DNA-binding CsgD family transcriptional regulator